MRLARPANQRQPRGGPVVVLDKGFFHSTVDQRVLRKILRAVVVERRSKQVILMLIVAVEAGLERITRDARREIRLRTAVLAGLLRRCRCWLISGIGLVIRIVVVVERRNLEQRRCAQRVNPREGCEAVGLMLP